MKNRFPKLLALMITFVMMTPRLYAGASFVAPLTFQHITQDLTTPHEIVGFMKDHFTFKDDEPLFGEIDYWQSPEEFLERREGDCEDFALFVKRIFDQRGIESYVVSFYGDADFAHTVLIFKTDHERYNVINEDRLYQYKAKSIEGALSRVYPAWSWGGIAEKRGNRGWLLKRLTNPDYNHFGSSTRSEVSDSYDFPKYFF